MGISLSVFLIAVGALLAWAIDAQAGADVRAAGVILVVVGVMGFVASLVFWSSWGGFGRGDSAGASGQNTTMVERDRPV